MKDIAVDVETVCLWLVDHSYDRCYQWRRDIGARDAAASPSNFFRQIWIKFD